MKIQPRMCSPEFEQFSASFNNMIARLDEGFAAQRQFTGNAAHELRTPLALMQAQMELYEVRASRCRNPEVTEFLKLVAGANRAHVADDESPA